jgi:hypothetical protein
MNMKYLLLICAAVLFLGTLHMPIEFYSLLRIVVFIGSISIIANEFGKGFSIWIFVFGFMALLFNPFLPVYLKSKSIWILIDLLAGLLFLVKVYFPLGKGKN